VRSRHDNIARVTEDFGYDSLGRLESWTIFQRCRRSETRFSYDAVGNLLSRRPVGASQDCSADFNLPTGGGYNPDSAKLNGSAEPVVHDADGRLESVGPLTIEHDGLDRLRLVSNRRDTQRYLYNSEREFVVRDTNGRREVSIEGLFRRRVESAGTWYEYFIPAAGRRVARAGSQG